MQFTQIFSVLLVALQMAASVGAQAQEMLSQSERVDIIVACEQAEHDYALSRGSLEHRLGQVCRTGTPVYSGGLPKTAGILIPLSVSMG